MDRNFNKITFLDNHDIDQHVELQNTQREMRQVSELKKVLAVQREIIAEQAIKVQELQEKLKKYGWNM